MDCEQENPKQCFTPIQVLASALSGSSGAKKKNDDGGIIDVQLCPSMDLVALVMEQGGDAKNTATTNNNKNKTNRFIVRRTVSWQSITSGICNNESQAMTTASSSLSPPSGTSVSSCWSPDGRYLAVGHAVDIYDLEDCMQQQQDAAKNGGAAAMASAMATPAATLDAVSCLTWSHVGMPHPTAWIQSAQEKQYHLQWEYQRVYLDKSSLYLPPSAYHLGSEATAASLDAPSNTYSKEHSISSIGKENGGSKPNCQTPLSLLCVSTSKNQIHLLLHGQYKIATLQVNDSIQNVVSSSDLVHLSILKKGTHLSSLSQHSHRQSNNSLTIFSLALFQTHRYSLQTISAHYTSIQAHLQTISSTMVQVAASWKNALRPLDQKLTALLTILKNYGHGTTHESDDGNDKKDTTSFLLPKVFLHHVAFGQASKYANPLEQFLSGVHMNDQLVGRMEKNMTQSIRNMETMVKRGLVAPAQSLVYDVSELHGLELLSKRKESGNYDAPTTSISQTTTSSTNALSMASKQLLLSIEYSHQQLVTARSRLNDLLAFLRAMASSVKPVASKRRIPHETLHRVCDFLRHEMTTDRPTTTGVLTEQLMGVPLSSLLSNSDFTITVPGIFEPVTTIYSLVYACNGAKAAVKETFDQPKAFLLQNIHMSEIQLPFDSRDATCPRLAIHSRIGQERDGHFHEGVFQPKINGVIQKRRHWTVVAIPRTEPTVVQILLVPLPPVANNQDNDSDNNNNMTTSRKRRPQLFLGAMALPDDVTLLELGFYGDDGKSTLISGQDSGTGKERRQALGMLIQRPNGNDEMMQEEIWLVGYDEIPYHTVTRTELLKSPPSLVGTEKQVLVLPLGQDEDEELSEHNYGGFIFAKTRIVAENVEDNTNQKHKQRLFLSGSRGIGALLSGTSCLSIFDLEEDEEEDEDEDSDILDED